VVSRWSPSSGPTLARLSRLLSVFQHRLRLRLRLRKDELIFQHLLLLLLLWRGRAHYHPWETPDLRPRDPAFLLVAHPGRARPRRRPRTTRQHAATLQHAPRFGSLRDDFNSTSRAGTRTADNAVCACVPLQPTRSGHDVHPRMRAYTGPSPPSALQHLHPGHIPKLSRSILGTVACITLLCAWP
jgi:hypothetical protein